MQSEKRKDKRYIVMRQHNTVTHPESDSGDMEKSECRSGRRGWEGCSRDMFSDSTLYLSTYNRTMALTTHQHNFSKYLSMEIFNGKKISESCY